ncbi:hypothetical protein ACVWYF_003293 [Hymenobacter sp. UYAg731]
MPYNSLSLNNLQRKGSKPGRKKTITLPLANKLVDLLADNHALFVQHMHSLSPKDYCDAYLKLVKMVIPAKLNLDVAPTDKPVWNIVLASTTVTAAATDSVNDNE